MDEQSIIRKIEEQIRNNYYNDKEILAKYLKDLRMNGILSSITDKQIEELLQLYDNLHQKDVLPLDMQNYSSVALENQNLIVSKQEDRILTTLEGTSEFVHEFQQEQNEILANSPDGRVNADAVFKKWSEHKKEEQSLISLTDAISRNDIELEVLSKLRFFITNSYINPSVFKINIETGIFYNLEEDAVYEVKKNPDTNQYEIYKSSQKVHGSNTEEHEEPILESETEQQEMSYEARMYQPKKRIRKLETNSPNMRNAAFTKIGFLLINIITFTILTIMTILLNK